jgi:hypothetical protein
VAAPERLRVIAWGTGAVDSEMVTTILDHRPDLDIVGARVYSPAKAGTDIGTLVGRDPICARQSHRRRRHLPNRAAWAGR